MQATVTSYDGSGAGVVLDDGQACRFDLVADHRKVIVMHHVRSRLHVGDDLAHAVNKTQKRLVLSQSRVGEIHTKVQELLYRFGFAVLKLDLDSGVPIGIR